jgi:hypothetical protein
MLTLSYSHMTIRFFTLQVVPSRAELLWQSRCFGDILLRILLLGSDRRLRLVLFTAMTATGSSSGLLTEQGGTALDDSIISSQIYTIVE